jgi:hypothetical protein
MRRPRNIGIELDQADIHRTFGSATDIDFPGNTYPWRSRPKAQNQCRMTLETLSTIKNPPVVYAKQANIAHGPQQVNNGTAPASHANETAD